MEVVINHFYFLASSVSKILLTYDFVGEVVQTNWPYWIARVIFHYSFFKTLSFFRTDLMLDLAQTAEQKEPIKKFDLSHIGKSRSGRRLVSYRLLI